MRRLLTLMVPVLAACTSGEVRETAIPTYHLADSALVVIPDAAPDGRYTMSTIQGAALLHQGQIAVWTNDVIYQFDSAGSLLSTFGRRGAGPGEFRFVSGVAECRPDHILAWDGGRHRLTEFSLSDSSFSSAEVGGLALVNWFGGCASDRMVLAAWRFDFGSVSRSHEPVAVVTVDPVSGQVDTVAILDGPVHAGPLTLLPSFPVVAARDSILVIADNATGRIVMRTGHREDTIQAHLPRLASRREVRDSVRAWWRGHSGLNGAEGPPDVLAQVDRSLAELALPDSLPYFSALMLDDRDRIWVSDYVGMAGPTPIKPTRWTRLGPDGAATETVVLPSNFTAQAVASGRFLGIVENGDGSLSVEVRAIEADR